LKHDRLYFIVKKDRNQYAGKSPAQFYREEHYLFKKLRRQERAAEAENRVYMATEQKINEEYAKLLSDYFSSLLSRR